MAAADILLCEDTRTTAKLLERYGIRTRLMAYHEHNAAKVRPAILRSLGEGQAIALVSDAGMPLVSDPGYRLVADCVAHAIPVTAIPGASAVLTALALSGLPTDRFVFLGFLPTKSGERKKLLNEFMGVKASLIAFESPHRIVDALGDVADVLGNRRVAVSRELTKLHEEVLRGTATEVQAILRRARLGEGRDHPGRLRRRNRVRHRRAMQILNRPLMRRLKACPPPKPRRISPNALIWPRRISMPASWRAKMSRSREKAEKRGHVAEFVALMYLRLKGYRLLAQRFKSPQGEVDLIMRRRDVTAFIEVKARGSRDRGVEAVTITQSRRISAAARFWMARDRISNRNFCRFDIVVVSPYLLPHHIENAFPGDG